MFDRTVEEKSLPLAAEQGSGFIAFSPLAQGLLTKKYLHGIPAVSYTHLDVYKRQSLLLQVAKVGRFFSIQKF